MLFYVLCAVLLGLVVFLLERSMFLYIAFAPLRLRHLFSNGVVDER